VKKEQMALKNKRRNCHRVFTIQSGNDGKQAGSASRAA
jgi:hypothetical protein